MNNFKTKLNNGPDIEDLIEDEDIELKHLDDFVEESLYDEASLSKKIQEIEEDKDDTFGQKLSDYVAWFGGSWKFIITLSILLVLWMYINTYTRYAYDGYPYIFLTLILSCIAALQAPIIMMSQNRVEEKDRRRSRSDYMLNLKSEMEIQRLHKKFDKILEVQKSQIGYIIKIQKTQIDSLNRLHKALDKNK